MIKNTSINFKNSITAQFLKIVFSLYLFIALTVTSIHMIAEYYHVKDTVLGELKIVQKTIELGLANALWDEYTEQVQSILEGTINLPMVVGLKVKDERGNDVGSIGIINQNGEVVEVAQETKPSDILDELFWHEAPIFYPHKGELVRVGEITIFSKSNVVFQRVQLGFALLIVNAIIKTTFLWIIFLWVGHFLLSRPLTSLTFAAEHLKLENLENTKININISKRNELKVLEETFNMMIQKLLEEARHIQAISKTFQKFVPQQFMNRIGAEGIENIKVGKAEKVSMTILFADIRSFTDLSESLTPQQVLDFLNTYLQRMNKPIHQNGGFVDKFIGDAIMALFDLPDMDRATEAYRAVQAACDIFQALDDFNQQHLHHEHFPISIGVGIHSGPVVMGTVGSEDRMDSTVLGDTVNVASRLERLTKYYKSQIIISEQTYQLLQEQDHSFLYRKLDCVNVKGKQQHVQLYEVLDSNPEPIRNCKQRILPIYEEGLHAFYTRNWTEALKSFQECLNSYPDDFVSQIYLERSQLYFQTPPSADWDGVWQFDHK